MPFDLDERYVQAAEQALGASFPTTYRLAMMSSNGGTVATESDDWELYPIADDSDRKRLARTPMASSPRRSAQEHGADFHQAQFRWAATAKVTRSSFSRVKKGLVRRSSSGDMRRVSRSVSLTTSPPL
jgi:hypothetical protein